MVVVLFTMMLTALLYVINGVAQSARKRLRVGVLSTTLSLVFLVTPLVALGWAADVETAPNARIIMLTTCLVFSGVGLLLWLLDTRRQPITPVPWSRTRGPLALTTGLLTILAVFALLPAGALLETTSTPTPIAQAVLAALTNAPRQVATVVTPVPEPSATPTASRTASPTQTPTATRTRVAAATPTQPATVAASSVACLGTTLYNVNLRSSPTRDAQLLLTIPFSTTLTFNGRNTDGTWFYTRYEDTEGWLDAEFVTAAVDCANLPVRDAE